MVRRKGWFLITRALVEQVFSNYKNIVLNQWVDHSVIITPVHCLPPDFKSSGA